MCVLLAPVFFPAHVFAQVAQSSDSEELRRRAQQEAMERQRQRQQASVVLPRQAPTEDAFSYDLPVEELCFRIERLTLEIPAQTSD
ncbi:MAG TPA: ShlB/FhaC/HecB family hemolysin secretion/activation protein, partial [Herbaspirillum sp.]|nr:ShlB/FhaC/HecB family hemolysin secretion/activation protein [Herbaspirillum sp.]